MKIAIYVGCALTQAPPSFRQEVERIKEVLRREIPDCEILDFIGLENGTATDVYRWDIGHCVGTCKLFVAICDYPAIGLGYELAVAVEKLGTLTLAVAHRDTKVTRLVLGIDRPNFEFRRYGELGEIVEMVKQKLQGGGELLAA